MIDYEETFAPVARISSIRALLTVADVSKWDLFQMDFKNAFSNGNLSEEFYMPLLNHPLMNRSKMSHLTLNLGPLLLFHLKILHKIFHLVTQLR